MAKTMRQLKRHLPAPLGSFYLSRLVIFLFHLVIVAGCGNSELPDTTPSEVQEVPPPQESREVESPIKVAQRLEQEHREDIKTLDYHDHDQLLVLLESLRDKNYVPALKELLWAQQLLATRFESLHGSQPGLFAPSSVRHATILFTLLPKTKSVYDLLFQVYDGSEEQSYDLISAMNLYFRNTGDTSEIKEFVLHELKSKATDRKFKQRLIRLSGLASSLKIKEVAPIVFQLAKDFRHQSLLGAAIHLDYEAEACFQLTEQLRFPIQLTTSWQSRVEREDAKVIISYFKKAFTDDNRNALDASLRLLEKSGPKCRGIVPELISILSYNDMALVQKASAILSNIGKHAVPALIQKCQDEPQQIPFVLPVFTNMYGEASEAVPYLKELLVSKDPEISGLLTRVYRENIHCTLIRVLRGTRAVSESAFSTEEICIDYRADWWPEEYILLAKAGLRNASPTRRNLHDTVAGVHASGSSFLSDAYKIALREHVNNHQIALVLFLAGDESPECLEGLLFRDLVEHVIRFGWDDEGRIRRQLSRMKFLSGPKRKSASVFRTDFEWVYYSFHPDLAEHNTAYSSLISPDTADSFHLTPFFYVRPATLHRHEFNFQSYVRTDGEFWLEDDLRILRERETSPRPYASWDADLLPAIERTIARNRLEERTTIVDPRLADLAKVHWLITGKPTGFHLVREMADDVLAHRDIPFEYLSFNPKNLRSNVQETFEMLLFDLEHFPEAKTIDTLKYWEFAFTISSDHVETARKLWATRPTRESAMLIFNQLSSNPGRFFDRQGAVAAPSSTEHKEFWGLVYQMKEYVPLIHSVLRKVESDSPASVTRDEARRALMSTGGKVD